MCCYFLTVFLEQGSLTESTHNSYLLHSATRVFYFPSKALNRSPLSLSLGQTRLLSMYFPNKLFYTFSPCKLSPKSPLPILETKPSEFTQNV